MPRHRSNGIAKNQAATYLSSLVERCYVALGANLGFACYTLSRAATLLKKHPLIFNFYLSPRYRTTPVSPIPQPHFINAVCRFETKLPLASLFDFLREVEDCLGKRAKGKQEPRMIDLDLLFYGTLNYRSEHITVPHPRWQERLFVLRPLADLTEDFGVQDKLRTFSNLNQETVVCLSKSLRGLAS